MVVEIPKEELKGLYTKFIDDEDWFIIYLFCWCLEKIYLVFLFFNRVLSLDCETGNFVKTYVGTLYISCFYVSNKMVTLDKELFILASFCLFLLHCVFEIWIQLLYSLNMK